MLAIDRLTKRYPPPPRLLRPFVTTAARGTVEALREVDVHVAAGEVVGLVGPNGAGKTTLLKLVAGLLDPSEGTVRIEGRDVTVEPLAVKRRIGLVLADDRGLYWRLTGRQNLELFGVLAGLRRSEARARAEELLEAFELSLRDKRVFGYSSGMRARLAVARALVADPRLVILDEPTRSLDPVASAAVGTLLRSLADDGRAVLLSSHRLDEVVRVCDRLVILVDGTVRFVGPPRELERTGRDVADELVARLTQEVAEPARAPVPAREGTDDPEEAA